MKIHDSHLRTFYLAHEEGLIGAGTVLLFLVGWQTAARNGLVNPLFISAPTLIARAGYRLVAEGDLWQHLRVSGTEFVAVREVKANPQAGIDMLKKHLKYDQAVAEAGYREFAKSFAEDGRLPVKGFEFLLAEEEKAGKLKEKLAVSDLIDEEFVTTFRGSR